MDYQEYKQLRKQIEEEFQLELDALDKVWKRLQSIKSPSRVPKVTENGEKIPKRNFSNDLRAAIKGFSEEFTADDVEQALIDHGFVEKDKVNRLSITNALHRLHRRGEISVVQKGQGRIGAKYRIDPLKEIKEIL